MTNRLLARAGAVLVAQLLAGCQLTQPPGSSIGRASDAPQGPAPAAVPPATPVTPAGPAAVDPGIPTGPATQWSDPLTWGGSVPQPGTDVTIPAGKAVVLDVSTSVRSLTVLGDLVWADKDGLHLTADRIMVHGPGTFRMGTAARPFTQRATITLAGGDPAEDVMGMGTKFFAAMMGGTIEIHGEDRVDWTRLGATAEQGATQITLAGDPGWRVGESVVLASTMLDPGQAEERVITAVAGATVTLDRPLEHQHWGTTQTFDDGRVSVDERAEVGLLSRNIVIQGDEGSVASKLGGHMMIMGSDAATIETDPAMTSSGRLSGVELRRMGQFDRLGRYPFHWHRNGVSTGDYIEGSAIHQSIQRGIAVHGTSNVRLSDNVVYNTPGHAIGIETGAEYDNVVAGNLALNPVPVTLTQATLRTQGDDRAAAYWIKGVNNSVTDNVAAGGMFGGFWFDDPEQDGQSRLTFTGNTAHSHAVTGGAAVWLEGRRLNFGQLQFSGLSLHKNGIGFWPDNDSPATVEDSTFADNKVAATGDSNVIASSVVGRTANVEVIGPTYNERWGGAGIRVYNNGSTISDVTFVNFTDDAAAVSASACRNEAVRFFADRVRWVNAVPAYCTGDTVIADQDGSFSGTGRPATIVSDPVMFTPDLGCQTRGDGGTLCPPAVDYQYMFLKRDLGVTPDIGVRREIDGLQQTSTFFPGMAITIPGQSYALDRGPADIGLLNLYLTKARKDRVAADPASRVSVSLPAPTGDFAVWRSFADGCYTCGLDTAEPKLRTRPLPAVASMAELRASDGEAYYYDPGAQLLHLILGPDKPVAVERTG